MSQKVKTFSAERVPLTGNPGGLTDPDTVKTGESLQDRVARLEREKIQGLLDFASKTKAAKKRDAACVSCVDGGCAWRWRWRWRRWWRWSWLGPRVQHAQCQPRIAAAKTSASSCGV
jgi:hypothetical protein